MNGDQHARNHSRQSMRSDLARADGRESTATDRPTPERADHHSHEVNFERDCSRLACFDAVLDPLMRIVWEALCEVHGAETANRFYAQVRWVLRDEECHDVASVLHWHGIYEKTVARYGSLYYGS